MMVSLEVVFSSFEDIMLTFSGEGLFGPSTIDTAAE